MPRLELAALDLAPEHLAELRRLLRQHVPNAEVWAYGSRVNGKTYSNAKTHGNAHEGSDLDLVLRHSQDLSRAVTGKAALEEALQNSLLPMLVDVHQWAELPTLFQRNIEAVYVVIDH